MNSSLGAYSYIQSGSVVCNTEIGKFCSISSNVSIGLANHPLHLVSTSPIFYDNLQPLPKFLINRQIFTKSLPRTIIGADVWIGQGVLIKAGVTIGVGAVIGAGSIVTKDILPYTIAAGNPCRSIRQRFEKNIVNEMLQSKWWMLEEASLEKLAPTFENVEKFLSCVRKL
jgi:acetyltransferase-like isoleucine patch superfamily enzyme